MTTHYYGSADSTERNNGNPVVASVPQTFKPRPVFAGQSTQQQIRNLEYNNQNVPFLSGAQLKIDEDKKAEEAAAIELARVEKEFAAAVKGIGGSGGGGMSNSDQLARDQFNYNKNTAAGVYKGLQDYSTNASWKPGFDSLRGLLDDQNRTGTQTINDTYDTRMGQIAEMLRTGNAGVENIYDTGMSNIGEGYDTASGMTSNAYNTLDEYLKTNQTNPYENYKSSYTPNQNAMGSYLDAYGVSNDPVNEQVQAQNFSGQQGADAFTELNKILGGITNQSNLSRLAESQFGRTGATTALSSQRAGYESNADMVRQNALQQLLANSQTEGFDAGNSQQDALNNLLTAINAGNFDIAQGETKVAMDAEQAAINAYVPPGSGAGSKSAAVTKLVNQTANVANKTLAKRAKEFVAKNPKATAAQVAKQFPSLSKVK